MMTAIKKLQNLFLALIIGVLLTGLSAFTTSSQDEKLLSVIVNTPTDEISFNEMKTIMRGERQRWKDGTKVVLALMKTTTPIGELTADKVYKMSASQLNKYWLAQVFQGRVQAPNFFTSESELVEFVRQTKGAIGVVTSNGGNNSEKVLVEGKTEF
jgi:ABC-type phosphate transport system substrate-binding protein